MGNCLTAHNWRWSQIKLAHNIGSKARFLGGGCPIGALRLLQGLHKIHHGQCLVQRLLSLEILPGQKVARLLDKLRGLTMHHLDSFDILRSLSLSPSLSLSNSEIKYDTGPCNDCVKLRGLTVISIAVVYTWQFSSYIDWPIPNCRKWTPPSHLNAVFFLGF